MKNLIINANGTVRFNNEKLDYSTLCENFEKVSVLNTANGDIDIFKVEGGFIEYFGDGAFASGEDVNFTDLSIEEIKEYYEN
jgi:hypothetical protein